MDWSTTRANRVCDACFGGDILAMRDYAATYVREGHKGVRPLGAAFRDLLPGRARGEFWEKALRQLDAQLNSLRAAAANGGNALPAWTEKAGGRKAWERWIVGKVASCDRRAREVAAKKGAAIDLPSKAEWRQAIREAVKQSDGRGHFSRLPLSLDTSRDEKHPCWPSVEHLEAPMVAAVGLELRVFNDLKTILSLEELREVVGHLAVTMNAPLKKLSDGWRCKRSFAVAQPPDEPPLSKP